MSKIHAIRLKPGQDLKKEIEAFVALNKIEAGFIATCVGSLTQFHIRFSNQSIGNKQQGHFEIVSINGIVSIHGSHIHISLSDETGKTIGGHLLDENIVYTTAEIIIQEAEGYIFTRENDGSTAWKELMIQRK